MFFKAKQLERRFRALLPDGVTEVELALR